MSPKAPTSRVSRVKKSGASAYHHGDLRQALVTAALRALQHQRAEDLSLRALGRELGVSPRAPYRHFETKEELLAAGLSLSRRPESSPHWPTTRMARGKRDVATRSRGSAQMAEAYVAFAVERPAAFRVMYAPYATVKENAPDLLAARADGHRATMATIAEGQGAGLIRPGDPMPIALALWSSMQRPRRTPDRRAARAIRPARRGVEDHEARERPRLRRGCGRGSRRGTSTRPALTAHTQATSPRRAGPKSGPRSVGLLHDL